MRNSKAQRHSLQLDLKEKERMKDKLIDTIAMEEMTDIKLDLLERVKKVKQEIESVKKEIMLFEEMESVRTDEFVDVLVLCSNLKKQYEKLSDMKKREVVILAFKNITAYRNGSKKDRIDFEWNEPFRTLFTSGLNKLFPKGEDFRTKNAWDMDVVKELTNPQEKV
jgi:hypothetical protein